MKSSIFDNKAVIYIQTLVLFITLLIIWYSNYYYTLYWLEGFSFFSTLPDFTSIQMNLPTDIFKYIGAYLLQFFQNPLYGAAIQAGIATFIVLCIEICILRLFKKVPMSWIAFIPIPFFINGQYEDITLERSMQWCMIILLLTVICLLLSIWKKSFFAPKWLQSPFLAIGIPTIILGISIYQLTNKDQFNQHQEQLCQIDYHANHQNWQEILEIIQPNDTHRDEFKLRYALLALSETGQLGDHLFKYGIRDFSQFLFIGNEEPFQRNFNALFYQSLDMPNEIIHQCYQQSLTSPFGFNFKSFRLLTDTYLHIGNYDLANKYLEVLRHTSMHKEWIEERTNQLNSIKQNTSSANAKDNSPFVGNFLETMTSLVEQYPNNKKFADLYLSGILTTKNAAYFYQAFQFVASYLYANGECIPRHFEEALLLISLDDKTILSRYNISKESKQRFHDFLTMYQSNNINTAKLKHAGSYWNYVYFQ